MAKATGWSADFIDWELSLARGYAIVHAALVAEGAVTRRTKRAAPWRLRARVDALYGR